MTQHPITPPPELVQQWMTEARSQDYCSITEQVAFHAAQWGADQELEACCVWLAAHSYLNVSELIQAARRPKPPSLKEINLKHLDMMERDGHYLPEILQDLRRAVEQLND